jgi:hypothetical protein
VMGMRKPAKAHLEAILNALDVSEPCKCGKRALASWYEAITDAGNMGTDSTRHSRGACETQTERRPVPPPPSDAGMSYDLAVDDSYDLAVDDWIEDPTSDAYAAWVLHHFRLPAMLSIRFARFMAAHPLFCTYEGKPWRVTGASRLGDVWLVADPIRDAGYDRRARVGLCSEWRSTHEVRTTDELEARDLALIGVTGTCPRCGLVKSHCAQHGEGGCNAPTRDEALPSLDSDAGRTGVNDDD